MLNSKRLYYLDFLRVFSSFLVIVGHVCSLNWATLQPESFEWNLLNVFESFLQTSVPIFFMISGALFLDENKDIRIKDIYFKYIPRLLTAYLFWSLIYMLYSGVTSLPNAVYRIISGHFHMWFIPALIGIYIIVPFLRAITKTRNLTIYYLVVAVIFSFILYFFAPILEESKITLVSYVGLILNTIKKKLSITFILGNSPYFVLGYFLNKFDFNKKARRLIYLIGIAGFFITLASTYFLSVSKNQSDGTFYNRTSFSVFLEAAAIFVFVKYNFKKEKFKDFYLKKLEYLSKCSFGVFLVHPMIIDIINHYFDIKSFSVATPVGVPVVALFIALISYVVSWILNKIPFVNKYIV